MGEKTKRVVTLARKRIAENQVFDVYFDHLAGPGENEVPTYLVVAPKAAHENLVTGVGVLPEMDGRLGLLRVYRHAIGAVTLEVPRGFVESGEPDAASAMRELDEEAGLVVAPEDLQSAGFMTPEGSLLAARVHLFFAHQCRRVRSYAPEELGHRGLEWFTPAQALAMAAASEIQDPSTLLLVYRYALEIAR
ncbi:MAG: NUDIX hydrolase [Betaproteobacteria bacterium]|nr:NUDIX hydrolase [Betaproteobacteria bacterium]